MEILIFIRNVQINIIPLTNTHAPQTSVALSYDGLLSFLKVISPVGWNMRCGNEAV